ncbi:MAG: glycosyltransferase family 2 protein [Pseudomonadota bacterium]
MKHCVVIPHFNHADQLSEFLPKLMSSGVPVIVVDDGSDIGQREKLRALLATYPDASLHFTERNEGKGAAFFKGVDIAGALGFTHVVQIDADGQHDAKQLVEFIGQSCAYPRALICGAPIFDDDAPRARVYGRRVTDFFVMLETLSLAIRDSLCGYRVYPLDALGELRSRYSFAEGMGIDTDLIVKFSWEGVPIRFLDTRIVYGEGGVSHFRYFGDNLRLVRLHVRLLWGAFFRIPRFLFGRRRLKPSIDHRRGSTGA